MTMSKEQTPIEMAIEALEEMREPDWTQEYKDKRINDAIAALRSMPTQESAEPVKWMNADFNTILNSAMERWRLEAASSGPENYSHYVISHYTTPLYTHPPKPDQTTDSADPVAEAMCGDHGGIHGCSCSSCGSPLGPAELTAYCNGCGIRIKWPMADGSEYMVTPPTKPDQPRMVLTDEECGEIASTWWVRSNVPEYLDGSDWFATFLRYARDNGYLALAKPTDTQ